MSKPEFGHFLFNPGRKGLWGLNCSPLTPGCPELTTRPTRGRFWPDCGKHVHFRKVNILKTSALSARRGMASITGWPGGQQRQTPRVQKAQGSNLVRLGHTTAKQAATLPDVSAEGLCYGWSGRCLGETARLTNGFYLSAATRQSDSGGRPVPDHLGERKSGDVKHCC